MLAPWASDDSERKYFATTFIESGKCELVAISMHVYFSIGELRSPEFFQIRGSGQNTTRDKFLYNWFYDGKKYRVRNMRNGMFTDGNCRVQEISYDHREMHPCSGGWHRHLAEADDMLLSKCESFRH